MMVGDSHGIFFYCSQKHHRSLLEFSYPRLRLELAWGGPWGSSRKPKGQTRPPLAYQNLGKVFKGNTPTLGSLAHALQSRLSLVCPLVSIL